MPGWFAWVSPSLDLTQHFGHCLCEGAGEGYFFSPLRNLASSFWFMCFSEMLKGVRPKRWVECEGFEVVL